MIKRLITNYCRLRIDLHSDLIRENDDKKIDQYLKELKTIEYARLLARTLDDALSHSRYCEKLITVIDPNTDRRIQESIDERYLDLVSKYEHRKNGIGKNVHYYRVKSFKDLWNVLGKTHCTEVEKKPEDDS